jgi:thiol-disulfide isomerase/thioredoxin
MMNPEILANPVMLRALWAISIVAAGLCLYWLANRLILARARKHTPALGLARQDSTVLLYFTTPTCAPCETIQRPAIQQVKAQLGKQLEVIEIDASRQPELASQWGVMSVPTTFLIDAKGQPRHVNHGVITADKLLKQYYNIQN